MLAYGIIKETTHWMAVNKPAGLNVEQLWDYPSVEGDVRDYLKTVHNKSPYVGIVHRLDRPVSGVLLLAKRKQPLKGLNEQFANQKIKKTYWALTARAPENDEGVLEHYLIKDQKEKRAIAFTTPKKKALLANLSYKVMKRTPDYCLIQVYPHTGKYHQIRVQLASIGCPIIGDQKYGSIRSFELNSIALHARSIVFQDPKTLATLNLTAAVPDQNLWRFVN